MSSFKGLGNIEVLKNIRRVEEIKKGYSEDKKYYVETEDEKEYLVKVSDIKFYREKLEEFENMDLAYKTGIPMSEPIEIITGRDRIYSVFSWCRGEDVDSLLEGLDQNKQYELGFLAGEYLKRIHNIKIDKDLEDWESRFRNKKNKKIADYLAGEVRFEGDRYMIDYLVENEELLKNRPQVFHHGDYHTGNMVYDGDRLSIIDFNRFDYGDPVEEFNRIDFSAIKSIYFASGQVDGYMGDEDREGFFSLMAYYIASNTLSSIPWAKDYGQDEVDFMLDKALDTLAWFDNMTNLEPSWYREAKGKLKD